MKRFQDEGFARTTPAKNDSGHQIEYYGGKVNGYKKCMASRDPVWGYSNLVPVAAASTSNSRFWNFMS